jgi:hypothetical protein
MNAFSGLLSLGVRADDGAISNLFVYFQEPLNMTAQTISSVENLAAITAKTVESYNTVGKTLLAMYCNGVKRAVKASAERMAGWNEQNKPSLLSDSTREQWVKAQETWNEFVVQRVETDETALTTVMDRMTVAATSGIDAAMQNLITLDSPVARTVINTLVAFQVPVAEFRAKWADGLVNNTQKLEARMTEQADVVQDAVKKSTQKTARKAA